MSRAARLWERFWFEPDHAANLAAARIIVGVHALWHLSSRDFAGMALLGDFWVGVPTALRWRYLIVPELAALEPFLEWGATLALVCVVAGVYPRLSCFVAGVLVYHLAPLETVFWAGQQPAGRGLTLSAPLLLVLAASRSGDAARSWPRRERQSAPSWAYGWPRKLMWVLVAQIYLFAFLGKLWTSGVGWGSAEHMRRWFIAFNVSDWWRFQDVGLWIADHPPLPAAMGVSALLFQGTFVAAVLSRQARYILLPVAVLFGLGTAVTLNIHVGEGWLVLLFVNWWWVAKTVSDRRGHAR